MTNKNTLLIKNGDILDENANYYENKDIYIKEGKIIDISTDLNYDNIDKVIDASNCLITPGLVNLHCHSPMSLMRGMAEDLNIEEWFNEFIWKFETKLEPEDIKIGAKLGIVEMIKYGVTAFADHYFFSEKIAEAASEIGIKVDIATTIIDNEDDINKCVDLIKKWKDNKLVKFRFGPHSPYLCSKDILSKISRTAKDMNVGIHIHVAESKEQVEKSISKFNKTPFEVLDDTGILDNPTILAHGLWIQKEDLKLLNSKHTIAVSPKTYMKLSMGYGNIWSYSSEAPIAIGTDGAASSNTLNPLEQVRLFALIGKQKYGADHYILKEMWKLLFKGHQALNFNDILLEEGANADIVIWDLNKINTFPVNNILASLIYSSESNLVRDVIIDGQIIMKNQVIQNIDENKLLRDVKFTIKKVIDKGYDGSKIANYNL